MFPLFSLKRAFTFAFLLVASLPVLIFGLVNIQLVSNSQLEDVREQNMLLASNVAEEVASFHDEVRYDLAHVAQTLTTATVLQPGSADDFLDIVVQNSGYFESIYQLDDDYQTTHLGILQKLQAKRDDYARIDFSGHQLFREYQDIREPLWSNTFVSLVTGEPSVTLAFPSRAGFLLGNIRLFSLGELLRRYSEQSGVEIAIVDKRGTLVAHSIKDMALKRINFGNHPAVVSAMDGENTTKEFRQDDKYYLESVIKVPESEWIIWVGLDMHRVLAPINTTRNLLLATMLVAVFLASAISLRMLRRLMQPLTLLGQRAGEIAEGHYAFEFKASGFLEIDALAEQITSMTQAIKVREESIVTSEQRFRDLVHSIDGIVWEMEYPSLHFQFVSRQAEPLLGYPLKDWYEVPSFWEQQVHPDDVEKARSYLKLMTEKGEDHILEYRMVAADGRSVWIRDLVTVVAEKNQPTRLLGVKINITSHKELVEELSRSERNYREIFNSTSDAIFIHDAETGRVLDVNQAMLNMFNCSYEEALSVGVDKFSLGEAPYSSTEIESKLQEAIQQGSCSFEWRSRRMSGELFWSEVSLRLAMIGDQQRILATVRDISDHKEAAEMLQEANERLLLLVERMPLACILWTPDFTVSMWNPAAEATFGFTEEEMLGKQPYGTIVPEEARLQVEVIWSRLLGGDTTAHSENLNLTKSGNVISCEWYNTPLHGVSGEVLGVISMVQDISERKSAEAELAKYRASLEKLVKKRTTQLEVAQKELVQKEKLAVLGQLTATVSHEIRNPLGTVANALYLLKDALADEEHQHLARPLLLAERNIERCDSIISDLLDFSRQRKIQKEPLDIDAWLDELFGELSFPADVKCHRELTSQTILPVDSERLRRVLVNVINNALQSFDDVSEREKVIEISTRSIADHCEISVCDNGSGMGEEVLARIFEPMFSTKNFGVGLGVPIIKSLVEAHGGTVEYRSEAGMGTTVTMRLPLDV